MQMVKIQIPDRGESARAMVALSKHGRVDCYAARPLFDVFQQFLAVLRRAFARHHAQHQSMLGIHGGVVPVVSAATIARVSGNTLRLLLAYERPLLVELDLSGLRGKKRTVRYALGSHVFRPGVCSA